MARTLTQKYGPWALIAGASKGLGAAFAHECASRGLDLILLARGEDQLSRLASELEDKYEINTVALQCDLARADLIDYIRSKTADYEIGLLVYNAVYSHPGLFLSLESEEHMRFVETNCRGPALLCRYFAPRMKAAGRGGIILMASLSGFQGTPYVTHYSACKAYSIALAEGLWYELKPHGVDVLVSCPGPINTQAYIDSLEGRPSPSFPPIIQPHQVARETIDALGKGPLVVPGRFARIASFLMRYLLPRKTAVTVMGKATGKLYK